MLKVQILCVQAHTKLFQFIASYGEGKGKFLKRILTHLFSTKYNLIYMCHLDLETHISYNNVEQNKYFVYKLVQKNSNI